MANYSLTIGSKFRPFEYQELLAPVLMATQAHQAIEDSYSDLSTKSSIWDKLTDPGSRAHSMYESYASDLEQQVEQLSKYGLNPSSRQAMMNMRSRYSKEITPIEQAYKRREEQAKQQADIMAKDPTHIFARRAAETSLDDYIDNVSLDTISQGYSGALLTQQVSQAASALAKDARNDPNIQTELRRLLPYQYETIRRTGFAPEAIMEAILNSPNANRILTGIVDNVMANSGMNAWNYISEEDKQRILTQGRQYANQGLWSAVGQVQYGNITDSYGMQSALESIRQRNAGGGSDDDPYKNQKYRTLSNVEVQGNVSKLREDLQFLQSIANGEINNLSKKRIGIQKDDSPATRQYMINSYNSTSTLTGPKPSEYEVALNRYKNIAKRYGIDVNSWGQNDNKSLIDRIKQDISSNIVRSSIYQLNMTDQSQIASILEENSSTMFRGKNKRSGFKALKKDGTIGEELTQSEANEMFEEGKQHNLAYDPNVGFIMSYRVKDGGYATVVVDTGLLDFGTDDYTAGHKSMQHYIQIGDMANAIDLADEMMNGLYYRLNTQGVKQSSTGKIE